MAATQYQIFCKYLNEDTNKIVNNSSDKEWVSAQEWYQSKVAYNVTDKEASNAMTLAIDSPNTNIKQGETYRALYEAIRVKMATVDPVTKKRLRFDDLSVEEKKAYNLCERYLEILGMIANNECVVEYAMIRPRDELIAVPPIKSIASNTVNATTDFHHGGYVTYTSSSSSAIAKKYQQTTKKALLSNAKLLDNELSKIIYEQLDVVANEKYNMLFTFAGMVQTDEQLDGWLYEGSIHQVSGYRFFPDDNVLEYVSNHWHGGAANTVPGEVYKVGAPPVKSYNTTPNVPSVTGNAGITVKDVSFPECEMEICNVIYEGMERLQIQPWFLITTCNSLRAALTKVEQLIDVYGKDAVKLGKVVPLDQYIEIV